MLLSSVRYLNQQNLSRTLSFCKRPFCSFNSALEESQETKKKYTEDIDRHREYKKYKLNVVENLFLGLLEPTMLEYPQIRTQEEVDYLKAHKDEVASFLQNEVKPEVIESTGKIGKDVVESFYEKNIVGTKIQSKGKSLGYFESESSYIQESLAVSSSVCKTVSELEGVGYQAVNLFGSDAQKSEYIPKFLNGSCVSCLAHLENGSWVSSDSMETNAVKLEDGNFSISGHKTLVYNPSNSDIILVSARTGKSEENEDLCTLFIVDKNSKGVFIKEPLNTMGLRSLEICDVVFDNVFVSKDNIIGNINDGNMIITKLAPSKLSNGAQCVGVMRKIVNEAIDVCIHKNHFERPLYKYQYIQGKIGEMVSALYSAESMTYLMYGRVDMNNGVDIMLESLLVKIFSSEALNFTLNNFLQLFGRENCYDEWIGRIIRDSNFFSAFDDSNDYLRYYLGKVGVMSVLKQRESNKFTHPKKFILKKKIDYFDFVTPPGNLKRFLHLALEEESKILEFFLVYLNYWTNRLITAYGDNIFNRTYELCMLGEIVIAIYRVASVLGRASRSYCIGLRHSETDILIARTVALNSHLKVSVIKNSFLRILKHGETYPNIGKFALDGGKYSPVHPANPIRSKSQQNT